MLHYSLVKVTLRYVKLTFYWPLLYVQFAPKIVSELSVSISKVRTALYLQYALHTVRSQEVPSGATTILWLVNGSCKEVSVSEVKQG